MFMPFIGILSYLIENACFEVIILVSWFEVIILVSWLKVIRLTSMITSNHAF